VPALEVLLLTPWFVQTALLGLSVLVTTPSSAGAYIMLQWPLPLSMFCSDDKPLSMVAMWDEWDC
jgi:hypothetical protein